MNWNQDFNAMENNSPQNRNSLQSRNSLQTPLSLRSFSFASEDLFANEQTSRGISLAKSPSLLSRSPSFFKRNSVEQKKKLLDKETLEGKWIYFSSCYKSIFPIKFRSELDGEIQRVRSFAAQSFFEDYGLDEIKLEEGEKRTYLTQKSIQVLFLFWPKIVIQFNYPRWMMFCFRTRLSKMYWVCLKNGSMIYSALISSRCKTWRMTFMTASSWRTWSRNCLGKKSICLWLKMSNLKRGSWRIWLQSWTKSHTFWGWHPTLFLGACKWSTSKICWPMCKFYSD